MKKIIALLIALLILVSMVACAGDEISAEETTAPVENVEETTAEETDPDEEETDPADQTGLVDDKVGFNFGVFDDYE